MTTSDATEDVDRSLADLLTELNTLSPLRRAVACDGLLKKLRRIRPAVIVELRDTYSQKRMAELLGMSQQSVSKVLIDAGYRRRGKAG